MGGGGDGWKVTQSDWCFRKITQRSLAGSQDTNQRNGAGKRPEIRGGCGNYREKELRGPCGRFNQCDLFYE